MSNLRRRSVRILGTVAMACGVGLVHTGTAVASEPITVQPVIGSPSTLPKAPYSPFDSLVTQPGGPIAAVAAATPDTPVRGQAVERTGGLGADLLGSKPLGGNVYGGTSADIVPHDDDENDAFLPV